ncbi:cytochrome P450 [Microseira sp. BLCC-F43]|jgi:hypothetical protein|uniref:cytochrome P450 n=1 Tax=Microseira sp. BLCC-F43 TaxID=3153602 RepID=UPI0035B9DEB0
MTLNDMPRPKGKFLIGNLADFRDDPLAFVTKCAHEYSDIVPLRLGSLQACLLTNPDYIAQVLFTKEQELLIKTRGFRILRPVIGQELVLSEGETWGR